MNKYQILRQIVLAIRKIQNGAAESFPVHIPCTEQEAREALNNVALHRPAQGVEIAVNDGWVLRPSDSEWLDEEWVEIPEYSGIDIRPARVPQGPLPCWAASFGIEGLDPWFRTVHPDWEWAVNEF